MAVSAPMRLILTSNSRLNITQRLMAPKIFSRPRTLSACEVSLGSAPYTVFDRSSQLTQDRP